MTGSDSPAAEAAAPRRPWLILGARGFAVTLAALIEDTGGEVLGLIEEGSATRTERGFCVCGSIGEALERFREREPAAALGVGYSNLAARRMAWLRLRETGLPTPPLVHPQAYVARSATIGAGAVVMVGAVVDRHAYLGEAAVVWPSACVNHGSVIGANTFVSPNATICGDSTIGADSFIGAGALVADGSEVPAGSRLKMGERYWSKKNAKHTPLRSQRP